MTSDAVLMREMLLSFSLGQVDDLETMEALGINAEDLFLLMAQARLPMPHLSGDMTREMVNILNALPNIFIAL